MPNALPKTTSRLNYWASWLTRTLIALSFLPREAVESYRCGRTSGGGRQSVIRRRRALDAAASHAPIPRHRTIDHPATFLGPRVKNRAASSAIFFQRTESDLMPTALARARQLDCCGEGLLVRVKLAYGSTKANGRL